jgi:pimeloyl-ACP methyl ester carboxylesterase
VDIDSHPLAEESAMSRKILAAVAAAVLPLALAPAATAAAAPAPALRWGDCPPEQPGIPRDPRQECATLAVPLDHREPRGRTIDIHVSRLRATDPELRRGVLMLDSGGPGDTGLDFASVLGALMPAALRARYDIIAFDPRGVDYSAPITCRLPRDTDPELSERYPDVDGSIDRNVAISREVARLCAEHGGDTMPHVTTANTARDMDLIRAALGERRMSYLGYSYGTYLGAVYRTLFPHRLDRVVLDSAIDPTRFGYAQLRLIGIGARLRLPDFTRWAAQRDGTYHLGATPAAVRRTFDDLTARLDREPLILPDGTRITGNLVRVLTYAGMYRDAGFPGLAQTWQAIAAAVLPPAGRAVAPAAPAALARTVPEIPPDNQETVQLAIYCNDGEWPSDIETYRRNVAVDRVLFPETAGSGANVAPCAFWPFPRLERPVRVTGGGRRNTLIVQNLRDPATPWVGSVGLRRVLGSAAATVDVDQGGHGAYLLAASACANDTVTAFLTHGVLPAGGYRLCPGQAPPE